MRQKIWCPVEGNDTFYFVKFSFHEMCGCMHACIMMMMTMTSLVLLLNKYHKKLQFSDLMKGHFEVRVSFTCKNACCDIHFQELKLCCAVQRSDP